METASAPPKNVRRILLIAVACASPVLILLALWLLLTEVIFVPSVPTQATPAVDVVAYILDEKGLPTLQPAKTQAFIEAQTLRMGQDAAFRELFLSSYRGLSPDERTAFRTNLFEVLKPIILHDVQQFHALKENERQAFLDDKYVEFKRMEILWTGVQIEKTASDRADLQKLQEMILSKITPEELSATIAYITAFAERRVAIEQNAELRWQLEERARQPRR